MGQQEIGELLLQMCIFRLGLINMSEATKKMIASVTLVLVTPPDELDAITIETKDAIKKWVAKRCKQLNDKLIWSKEYPNVEYCLVLPFDPSKMEDSHPKLYKSANIDGCFVKPDIHIKMQDVSKVDNSYQCRNTLTAAARLAPQTVTPNNIMMQCQMLMMKHLQALKNTDRDGDLHLDFPDKPSSKKRSIGMLSEYGNGFSSSDRNSREQHLMRSLSFESPRNYDAGSQDEGSSQSLDTARVQPKAAASPCSTLAVASADVPAELDIARVPKAAASPCSTIAVASADVPAELDIARVPKAAASPAPSTLAVASTDVPVELQIVEAKSEAADALKGRETYPYRYKIKFVRPLPTNRFCKGMDLFFREADPYPHKLYFVGGV